MSFECYELPIDLFYSKKRKIGFGSNVDATALESYGSNHDLLKIVGVTEMERWDNEEKKKAESSSLLKGKAAKVKKLYQDYDVLVFPQEGLALEVEYQKWLQDKDIKLQMLKTVVVQDYKIPAISHSIYFTNNNSPIQIKDYVTKMILNSITRLSLEDQSYKHYFWTNNIALEPDVLHGLSGFQTRLISEFKDHLLYTVLTETLNKAQQYPGYYAQASDILRIIVLQKHGGIYHDNDYEILQADAIVKYSKVFDYFGAKEFNKKNSFIANCIIASKAFHPILDFAIELIARNLNVSDKLKKPDYVMNPKYFGAKVIFETGPKMLEVAYDKVNNKGNIDMIFPANILSDTDYVRSLYKESPCYKAVPSANIAEHQLIAVGGDLFCGDWCIKGSPL